MLADLYGYRTAIAEWASILALLFSGYAAFGIWRLRTRAIINLRLPVLVEAVEKNAKTLHKLRQDYEANEEEFGVEIDKCHANLRSIVTKVSRQTKVTVDSVLVEIAKYKSASDRDHAGKVYSALNGLIEELKHTIEEQRINGWLR